MKLSLNTDFTKFPRAVSVVPAGSSVGDPAGRAVLGHDERELRRRAIALEDGSKVLVDLLEEVTLADGDRLVLEDGRQIRIGAAPEELYEIRARDAAHLSELAWHIGLRRKPASIFAHRILIPRDHAMKTLLEGHGATVTEVVEPFTPIRGPHSDRSHDHGHNHGHHHDHDRHRDGERDAYGRLPGDPHYGHNHA